MPYLMLILFVSVFVSLNFCKELDAILGTALGLGHRYFVGCTVILHPYAQPTRSLMFLAKNLSSPWGQKGCVLTLNLEKSQKYMDSLHLETRCSRVLVIIYGDEDSFRVPFLKLTHDIYAMKGPLWLIILRETTIISDFLRDVNAPFDVDMIVAQYQQNDSKVRLNEIYRASLRHPVRVKSYGFWSNVKGLMAPPHVSLYYRRDDFEGIRFKVATATTFPATTVKRLPSGDYDITGYFATIWKELEVRLNFSSVYHPTPDNRTGILRGNVWTGVTGMIAREEVEIGVACLTISPDRSYAIDFLRPLLITRNQMYFMKPGLEIKMDAIFRPFQTWVWVSILVWLFVGSSVLSMAMKISMLFNIESEKNRADFNSLNSFFCVLRSFSQQGHPSIPESLSGRMLFLMTYLVGVVMLAAYSGALISFIAVQTVREPFRNWPDVLKDGTYKVIVTKDTAMYMYFANATHPTLNRVFNELMLKYDELPATMEEGLEHVCLKKKLIYFGEQDLAENSILDLQSKGCAITSLQHPLSRVNMAIGIQKNNQYKDALNHHLDMMIYQGQLQRQRKKMWPLLDRSSRPVGEPMKVEQVVQIMMVLVLGILIAVVVFATEKISKRHRNRKVTTVKHFFNMV